MITDACKYTCRFVSTIQKALIHMNAQTNAHVHTTTHMHMQHTNMHVHLCTTPHTHHHACPRRMDTVLCMLQARRVMTGLWRCSFRLGLQWTCKTRCKIVICSSVTCVVPCALFIVHLVPHNSQRNTYECQKTDNCCCYALENQIICALEACTFSAWSGDMFFPKIWTENASLGSKLQ